MCKGPEAGKCLEYRNSSKRFSEAEGAWVWEWALRDWWGWGPGPHREWQGADAFDGTGAKH